MRDVSLNDKYTLTSGTALMTGTHAMVRVPMMQREIDRAAIIGIDEAEIDQFGALIAIGDPRKRHPQQQLNQRVVERGRGDPRHHRAHLGDECGIVQQRIDQGGGVRLIALVRPLP